jgi:hypothetical protein
MDSNFRFRPSGDTLTDRGVKPQATAAGSLMSSSRIGGGSLTGICSDGKPGMCCSDRRLLESRRIHTPRTG